MALPPLPANQGEGKWRTETVGHVAFSVPESYTFVKKLGSGAYGTVAAFTDRHAQRGVAVKKVTSAFNDLIDAKRIVREVKILRHFDHDNVVRILDLFPPASPDFEDIYIVMDLMDTDLHRVIYSNQQLTGEHIQYFLYQMLRGLKYVHSANVIHRDLKPSNILVNKDCELKICDFGLARGFEIEEEDKDLTHYVVTRWYRAPEVILTARQYTKAIDVWAVGCILAEIVARKPLFQGKDPKDQIDLIIRAFGMPSAQDANWLKHNDSAYRFLRNLKTDGPKSWQQLFPNVKSSAWTKELLQMLNETLHFNPEKRISVQGAIELPYLKELHDPNDEPVCEYAVDWEFDKMEMTKRAIQNAIYQESADFHPYLEARDTAWFQQRNMRFPKPFNRRTRSNTLA